MQPFLSFRLRSCHFYTFRFCRRVHIKRIPTRSHTITHTLTITHTITITHTLEPNHTHPHTHSQTPIHTHTLRHKRTENKQNFQNSSTVLQLHVREFLSIDSCARANVSIRRKKRFFF